VTLASGVLISAAATAQPGDKQVPAEITIIVPGNAEIFFDRQPTKQKGTERLYVTPPLVVGEKYSYEVLARWQDGGEAVEYTRKGEVGGGLRVRVDFLASGPTPTHSAQPPSAGPDGDASGRFAGKVQGAGSPIAGSTVTLYAAGDGKPAQMAQG